MEADLVEADAELQYIRNKVGDDTFDKIYAEFSGDKDFDRANKIQNSFTSLNFTSTDREEFIEEVKHLFDSDGKRDIMEENALKGLKKLMVV